MKFEKNEFVSGLRFSDAGKVGERFNGFSRWSQPLKRGTIDGFCGTPEGVP